MARSVVLLKLYVANILLFNFCEQKFVEHGPITITIDFNGLSLLISEEKCPNSASGPKSAPNSDSFWVRRLFNVCVRVFCADYLTITTETVNFTTTGLPLLLKKWSWGSTELIIVTISLFYNDRTTTRGSQYGYNVSNPVGSSNNNDNKYCRVKRSLIAELFQSTNAYVMYSHIYTAPHQYIAAAPTGMPIVCPTTQVFDTTAIRILT